MTSDAHRIIEPARIHSLASTADRQHAGDPELSSGDPAATHQRSRGLLRLAWKRRDDTTVLGTMRQEGCLKIRFPRPGPAEWAGAVLINSAGGVAGGDRLRTEIDAGPDTRATVASQAAERFYRALPGSFAEVANTITVQAGGALEWLPQETILFDGSALRRTLRVALAGDASFLGVESLVFGRAAMGETLRSAHLRDLIEIRRDGRLLLHDRIRLDGSAASLLGRRAVAAGGAAVATLIHVAPHAEARLDALRTALAPLEAGASAWDGMLVARIVAENGGCLRAALVAGLRVLRDDRPLPRVWLC